LPEVISTLFYNFTLNKLKILPVTVEFNDSDPFNLDDISLLCNLKTILGPISIYDHEMLNSMAGKLKEITVQKGKILATPSTTDTCGITDLFTRLKLHDKSVNDDRFKRALNNAISIKMPKNTSMIQKARIKKSVHLYRQWARFGICNVEGFSLPVTVPAMNKIVRSVDKFKQQLKSVNFYIKEC
jgi:hypothetical protein